MIFKRNILQKLKTGSEKFLLWTSACCSLSVLFLIGYNSNFYTEQFLIKAINVVFHGLAVILLFKILVAKLLVPQRIWPIGEVILFLYFILIIILRQLVSNHSAFNAEEWLYIGIFSILAIELSRSTLSFDQFYFNPTLLFVFSFLVLILIGTSLLMLPGAVSNGRLSFVDALFMATSAVCVTGLSVVDIGKEFTGFGQNVLLVLIQLGALGVMTFTGFFGYFFTGGFSFKNQLMFTEFLNEKKTAQVTGFLLRIIYMTLIIEISGACLIYYNLDPDYFSSAGDQLYFSIFHAISAFCNAGFSTLSQGLFDSSFRFNYSFQLIIAFLLIFGGLGFAVILNGYNFLKRWAVNFYSKVFFRQPITYKAWVIDFNTRLVFYTTLFLIVFGTLSHLIFEYNRSFSEHPTWWGKIVSAFFTGVTPRTAGFNTIDMSGLSQPAIIITLFLMWIGASPASTGGGIRTTTFAIALLNIWNIAKGNSQINIFQREVSSDSVRRAFAIIFLSVIFLGSSVVLLSVTDSDKSLLSLIFESVSAYSTVGLSLGITPELSRSGRLVLIFSMFIGRVGTLTFLIALIRNFRSRSYTYPSENVSF